MHHHARNMLSLFACSAIALGWPPSPAMAQAEPTANSAINNGLSVTTATQKIPAGTMLRLAFQTPLDSRTATAGQPFLATLDQDFYLQQRLILPTGSVIRGYVDTAQKPRLFSKGGAMTLTFDHVTSPNGDLLPVNLQLSPQNTMVRAMPTASGTVQPGTLYTDPGVGKKLGKSVDQGTDVFNRLTQKGINAGKAMAGGLGMLVTVPATAIGGVVAGSAVTTGKAATAIVGRGDSVTLAPGATLLVDFGGAMDVPVD